MTDTTVGIFENRFRVRIPYIHSIPVETMRATGVRLSGHADVDNDIKNQIVTVYLTIDQMVEHYRNGVTIFVPDENDIRKIYELIEAHIYAWKAQLRNGVNIGDAPLEDLISMDQFANSVYKHAKYLLSKDEVDSFFANALGRVQTVNPVNLFNQSSLANFLKGETVTGKEREDIPTEDTVVEERDSLSEFFQERVARWGR